ncbi:energy transducer TonB [Erythrobacter sp. MTPC3]|uniref:energy transducer TonB n=1 Tax=Erythrobacter sp. MTPC3 TaxID=3056564 RepID=UPI0036F4310B
MGRFICSLALGALAISVPAALSAKETVLKQSSPWNVDFAPEKCRLAAFYGEEDNRHLLFFEQHFPGEKAGMSVAGPAFKRFQSRKNTALQFFAAQKPLTTKPFTGDMGELGPAVIYSSVNLSTGTETREDKTPTSLPQLDTEFAKQVEYVSLTQRGTEIRLETGPLAEAFKVLNTCTQDMVTSWGLDLDQHLSAQEMPKWTNEKQVARRIARTYPSQALNRGEQAILRMRVIVDETGKVADCVIDDATTTERLESPACREMRNARFNPAIGADGKPFKSFYATSITYQIGR